MDDYYVYALTNPLKNSQYFYIGKGRGDRCMAHFKEKKVVNPHKTNTIKQIQSLGLEVGVIKLKEGLTEVAAYDLEEELIAQYGRVGYEPNGILTNICSTYRPPKLSELPAEMQIEWRLRQKVGNKEAWRTGRKYVTEAMRQHLSSIQSMGGKAKNAKYGTWNKGLTKEDPRIQTWLKSREGYVHSDDTKAKMSKTRKGRKYTAEHSKAISDGKKGMKFARASCLCCKQEGPVPSMKRWHFENCRHK
jgi:hypothetical protein